MRLCVYCGSSMGASPRYVENTQALAQAMVQRRLGLVYGGAKNGLMGVLANQILTGGEEVIGIIPEALKAREWAHDNLSTLHVVSSMHERKAMMAELANGFVVLPGGFGTLDELCEIVTWAMLGFHHKPIGILNVGGYYEPLLAMIRRGVEEKFIQPSAWELIHVAEDPDVLLDQMFGATLKLVGTPELEPSPGNFGVQVTDTHLRVSSTLWEFLQTQGVRTVEGFLSFITAFPTTMAVELSWDVSLVEVACKCLVAQLWGKINPRFLAPGPSPRRGYGALPSPSTE